MPKQTIRIKKDGDLEGSLSAFLKDCGITASSVGGGKLVVGDVGLTYTFGSTFLRIAGDRGKMQMFYDTDLDFKKYRDSILRLCNCSVKEKVEKVKIVGNVIRIIKDGHVYVKGFDYDAGFFAEAEAVGRGFDSDTYSMTFPKGSEESVDDMIAFYFGKQESMTKFQRSLCANIVNKMFDNPDMVIKKYSGSFSLVDARDLSGDAQEIAKSLRSAHYRVTGIINNKRVVLHVSQ
jgi:hypothetical protein